ncbi:glycerophosphodiester phosphodiesterase [Streptococcus suis]|nr:glycerophosphodiester phosphodiesterase [Streptococcus suis]
MMYWLLSILVFLLGLFFYLLAPRRKVVDFEPFLNWDYAHRGFHDNAGPAPENSLLAIQLAVEKGYGIEFDIRLTKDGQLVVFHDENLKRTSGIDQNIEELTYEELLSFSLFASKERIPLLSQILSTVAGRVPLIVELKSESMEVADLCRRTIAELDTYEGLFMVESFNPLVVAYFRKHRPNYFRGQLSGNLEGKKGVSYTVVRHLLSNVIARPDFVAYDHLYQNNLNLRLMKVIFGIPLICYTVKNPEEYEKNRSMFDLQIFEGFEPRQLNKKQE